MRSSTTVIGGVALAALLSAGAAKADTIRYTKYSQNDPAWKNTKLGHSNLTIGNYGCLLTCCAMFHQVKPDTLNTWLKNNGGFSQGSLVVHEKVAAYDGPGGVTYSGRGTLPTTASAIQRGISRGALYVAASTRFAGSTHWVLIVEADSRTAWYIDPWDGSKRQVGDSWVKFGAETRTYSRQ